MSYTKGQSAALPKYTLRYTSTDSFADGGEASHHELELPGQLNRLEAAYWASVILEEIHKIDNQINFGGEYSGGQHLRPNLEIKIPDSDTEYVHFRVQAVDSKTRLFGIRPATESISAELMRLGVMAREIWGEDSSAITWGVRDLEINAQYPDLKRKLPEKPQAFLDRHNGDLAAAIKTSRLIDPWMPLTWYRSTQKAKG